MSEQVSKAHGQGSADDLFDVPVEAVNLPGMDAIDSAAALAGFQEAEPAITALAGEPEAQSEQDYGSAPSSSRASAPGLRKLWIAFGALALGNGIVLALGVFNHSPIPRNAPEIAPPATPETEAKPAASTAAVRPVPGPVPLNNGRARLLAIESTLEAGQRKTARAELGRILLDIDTLPTGEREDTRAQAELLVARILQEAADEARSSSR